MNSGHPLREADRKLSAAKNERDDLRNRLSNAERDLAKLEATCSAPDRATAAQAELDAATVERQRIEVALADIASKRAAMSTKDAELASRIAEIDAENAAALVAGNTPDLTPSIRAEAERRAVSSALAQLDAQAEHHRANLRDVADAQKAARDALRDAQTVVAQLERDAALRPILPIIVRAEIMSGRDGRLIEITVPQEVLDAVEASMIDAPGTDR